MSSNETSPTATRSNSNFHPGKRRSGWRNLLTPSYKSRSDEFLKLFCDTIPSTERLIADYSCALHREILIHGRVYISVNYIAFYSNLFRWVTKLVIKLRDVSEIYKANTAKFIPNAIQIVTTNGDKHVFASFIARDKSYVMILRIWQNNLMFERMSDTEMRNLVHFSYGRDLGMMDDEEFTVNSPEPPSPGILALDLIPQSEDSKKDFDIRNISSNIINHTVTPTSRKEDTCSENNAAIYHSDSSLFEKGHHRSNSEGRDGYQRNDEIIDQVAAKLTSLSERIKLEHATPSSQLPSNNDEQHMAHEQTDLKSVDDEVSLGCRVDEEAEPIELTTYCDCENHEGLAIVDYEFDINVDTLFTLIFTNSKFMRTYMARRGLFDVILGSWTRNSGSLKGSRNHQVKQSRQLTYSINLNHVLAKQVDVEENQTIVELRDGVYVLHSQTINSGIPYGDTFTVDTIYCLTRKGDINKSRMCVHTLINFKKEKSNWKLSIVKSMIERQSLQGVTDFIENLKISTDHYISNPSDFDQDTTDDNMPKDYSLRNRLFKKKTMNQAGTNEGSDISVSSEKSETYDTDDLSLEDSINESCMSTMKRRKRSDSTTINYMTMSNSDSNLNLNHKADSLRSFASATAQNRTFIVLLILMIFILVTNMIILDRLIKLESKCK